MFTDGYNGISICRLCGAMVPDMLPEALWGEHWDPQETHQEWHEARGEKWE